MNKNLKYFILSLLASALALIFFAWRRETIIFNFRSTRFQDQKKAYQKKKVTIYFWQNNSWNKEQVDIITTGSLGQEISALTKAWLTLIEEEKVIDKKITVQTAIVSPNGQEVYLSFDRNPFGERESTIEKLMLTESLLKTLRENQVPIKKVRFLKHHQSIWDPHLDFYHPWPIEGFL